jgi:hypothetical protein
MYLDPQLLPTAVSHVLDDEPDERHVSGVPALLRILNCDTYEINKS